MDESFLKIFDLARPFLDTRENEEHTKIAYNFAARLLDEESGDPDVVFPAVILHDVGWKSIPEQLQITAYGPGNKDRDLNRVHEREGARIAGEILEKVNYPRHLIVEIVAIVLGHDSRQESLSINDAIVKDSDKLWRYSEHGISVLMERFEMSFPQYLDRLRNNLENWLLTPAGKRMAREQLQIRERGLEPAG
ncbi:MAG: HD domain-containing protein [Desulfomonilaceae bacterium]